MDRAAVLHLGHIGAVLSFIQFILRLVTFISSCMWSSLTLSHGDPVVTNDKPSSNRWIAEETY